MTAETSFEPITDSRTAITKLSHSIFFYMYKAYGKDFGGFSGALMIGLSNLKNLYSYSVTPTDVEEAITEFLILEDKFKKTL